MDDGTEPEDENSDSVFSARTLRALSAPLANSSTLISCPAVPSTRRQGMFLQPRGHHIRSCPLTDFPSPMNPDPDSPLQGKQSAPVLANVNRYSEKESSPIAERRTLMSRSTRIHSARNLSTSLLPSARRIAALVTGRPDNDARGTGDDGDGLFDVAPIEVSKPGLSTRGAVGTFPVSLKNLNKTAQLASLSLRAFANSELSPTAAKRKRRVGGSPSCIGTGSPGGSHSHDDDIEGIDLEDQPPPAAKLRNGK
ncbi:hypothetical protein CYLTODRAFT_445932 [Cylindrobasidium torrendii FP15055 ss-10]|uniref:Uncharacterized protein n=1 Tax=Cylindrobasidium torrendii FP15055 ss-10 TaxID=1314674 RepID=A0A0D7B2T9_9AGAR|nr:hypothetical protein CYLTODRAFT_445932 [Cylindrobasidium torrendii FP15055 ss-10]